MRHFRKPGESDRDYLSRIAPNYRDIIGNGQTLADKRERQRAERRRHRSVAPGSRHGNMLRACLDLMTTDIERTTKPN
jgi:hypothetical protein